MKVKTDAFSNLLLYVNDNLFFTIVFYFSLFELAAHNRGVEETCLF